ncbi:MAG: HNH endonuclease [Bacteroidales bacterium]|nr:HNH endonuclease [Bacteroidales bacterium]
MIKKTFNTPERYAIWKSLGPKCSWCKTPVEYQDCHIDHIIPEKLLEDEEKLKEVINNYALEESFDINSFENWVPVHPSCNLTKGDDVIEGAPIFLELLKKVKDKAEETARIFTKWHTQNKTAKLTTVIAREAEKGSLDKTTVSQIFAGINDSEEPIVGLTGSTIDNQVFYVPSIETWKVIGSSDGLYELQKGEVTGSAPINPYEHPELLCKNCKHYGPWDGNKCLSCGEYSFE